MHICMNLPESGDHCEIQCKSHFEYVGNFFNFIDLILLISALVHIFQRSNLSSVDLKFKILSRVFVKHSSFPMGLVCCVNLFYESVGDAFTQLLSPSLSVTKSCDVIGEHFEATFGLFLGNSPKSSFIKEQKMDTIISQSNTIFLYTVKLLFDQAIKQKRDQMVVWLFDCSKSEMNR